MAPCRASVQLRRLGIPGSLASKLGGPNISQDYDDTLRVFTAVRPSVFISEGLQARRSRTRRMVHDSGMLPPGMPVRIWIPSFVR
jgi:hypothetical protein